MNTRNIFSVAAMALTVSTWSCIDKPYRMTTQINADGSCLREVCGKADSAFFAGDTSHNPFFFALDAGWHVQPDTPDMQNRMVKASRRFSSVGAISAMLRFDEALRPIAAPVEVLEKRFRWFYSYYTFTGTYSTILDSLSFLPDDYMSKAEQKIWFQGDFSPLFGTNGREMKEELEKIGKKFSRLYDRYAFERSVEAVQAYASSAPEIAPWVAQLAEVQDSVFLRYVEPNKAFEMELGKVCKMFDDYFATKAFSNLYKKNETAMDEYFAEHFLPEKLWDILIEYELVMPGKITYTNASMSRHDTLAWKVNAERFAVNDYVLRAQSRVVHTWAFVLTGLLAILAACCLLRAATLKKKYSVE
jgi:hypothetical protein